MAHILLFCRSVLQHWGSLVTGGCIIGIVGIWQGTGHGVAAWAYVGIASCALLVSFFKVWEDQLDSAKRSEQRIEELVGRPDLTLEARVLEKGEALARTGGRDDGTMYEFVVRNSGPVQAVNVAIDELRFPMSDKVKMDALAIEMAYLAEQGKKIGEIQKKEGWDQWAITFETVSSVPSGREAVVAFSIGKMGPLQKQDLCWPLQNTIRTLAPFTLPLLLRYSNRDGYTWKQHYDLTHGFKCRLSLAFKELRLVKRPGEAPKTETLTA